MYERRLPVYLLIDTSGSMSGAPIESVKDGVYQLIADLRNDPCTLEMVWLSLITFGGEAKQPVPLTPVYDIELPELEADGMTALGPALSLLCECRKREVQQPVPDEYKGDYRPLVFCFTDGVPTVGDLGQGIRDFQNLKWANHAFVAVGPEADVEELEKIAPGHVLKLEDLSRETITKGFWGLCRLSILNPSYDWEKI